MSIWSGSVFLDKNHKYDETIPVSEFPFVYLFHLWDFCPQTLIRNFMKRKLRSKILSPPSEAATGIAPQKNVSLKIWQNTEETPVLVSFF